MLEQPNGIFVRNLVFDATNEHLAEAFSQYGNVVDAKVARDARGLSKGQVPYFCCHGSRGNTSGSLTNETAVCAVTGLDSFTLRPQRRPKRRVKRPTIPFGTGDG